MNKVIIIIIILIFQFIFFNPFEKILFYLYRNNFSFDIYRPIYRINKSDSDLEDGHSDLEDEHSDLEDGHSDLEDGHSDLKNVHSFSSLGMPSGHTQIVTIILLLASHWNIFSVSNPLYLYIISFVSIFLVGYQRIYSKMHTLLQVIIGFLIGIIYVFIYSTLYSIHPNYVIYFIIFLLLLFNLWIIYIIDKNNLSKLKNKNSLERLSYIYSILINRDSNLHDFF